jgi:hypothetical protein
MVDGDAIAVFGRYISVSFPSSFAHFLKYRSNSRLLQIAKGNRYVAMHAMQDDAPHEHSHPSSNGYADVSSQRKKEKPQMRDTLAAVGGMLIPLLTQIGHHH